MTGSSPRVWGTSDQNGHTGIVLRFIPTGVGNITPGAPSAAVSAVHPHGCGEHFPAVVDIRLICGSSPRVWGTWLSNAKRKLFARFIPTGVGNIIGAMIKEVEETVHPHGCGEHVWNFGHDPAASGSSPRVWGTCYCASRPNRRNRFIPTGVGNIHLPCRRPPRRPVHPHGCGEHGASAVASGPSTGSSPRVWGTCVTTTIGTTSSRFIPTGVGNIILLPHPRRKTPVHPHGCGEHTIFWAGPGWANGSSPRVWGTLQLSAHNDHSYRFIPTGVGNIFRIVPTAGHITVHPHGCGEHEACLIHPACRSGSSPRVWGTWNTSVDKHLLKRFIPTGVGNIFNSAYI